MITIAKTKVDDSGDIIFAQDDQSGKDCYCINCSCEMYRRSSKLKNYHFACRRGQKHRKDDCQKVADAFVSLDLNLTDPYAFHEHISTPPAPGSDGPGPVPGPHKPRKEEEKFVAFRSLKDFAASGLLNVKKDFSFKNGMLSDILINSHFAPMIMRDNNSIGPRVLQVKPDTYFWHDQYIRFIMVSFVNDADGLHQFQRRKLFDFHIPV